MVSAGEGWFLRAVVEMLDHAAQDDPGPILPWSVIDDLSRLIPADEVTIADLDMVDESCVLQHGVLGLSGRALGAAAADDPADPEVFWRRRRAWWSGGPPSWAGEVHRWSDRHPRPELSRQPRLAELILPRGLTHGMTLRFPTAAGHELDLLFLRYGGSDFTDADMDLLRVLRPHLADMLAAGNRRRMGLLTPREWQVLELAAQGHANADIAAILGVSLSTVRKHMEHVFDRAGVRTRGAAVARLLPGLVRFPVGDPPGWPAPQLGRGAARVIPCDDAGVND